MDVTVVEKASKHPQRPTQGLSLRASQHQPETYKRPGRQLLRNIVRSYLRESRLVAAIVLAKVDQHTVEHLHSGLQRRAEEGHHQLRPAKIRAPVVGDVRLLLELAELLYSQAILQRRSVTHEQIWLLVDVPE